MYVVHVQYWFTILVVTLCSQVGDELLDINGNSTEGMLHSDAITIIKHGGDVVKLIVRRVNEHNSYPSHKGEEGREREEKRILEGIIYRE